MKKQIFILSAIGGLLLTLSSCNKENDGPNTSIPDADPIVMKAEYQPKTTNNRTFALELFKQTVAHSKGENVLISPYSVNTALGMAWNGAGGDTADELGKVLGNSNFKAEQINDYSKTLTDALLKVDKTTDLKIANSIWADNTAPFLETFVNTNQTWYGATVKNVDFTNAETLKTIDKWCMDNTANRIDKISEGMTSDTKFALINAFYFKGKWKYKFEKSATKSEAFTGSTGAKANVQMMNQKENLLYSDDDKDWKMLSLPYGNNAFSMVIMMPYSDVALDEKIKTLTAEKFYSLFKSLGKYKVTVKLPRFKADYGYKLHEGILPSMGITKILDSEHADLSAMSQSKMYVDLIMHKTFIEIDEQGTEAAASTSVSGGYTSPGPGTQIEYFVDRPFIYSIVENSTGTILFMGRINNL